MKTGAFFLAGLLVPFLVSAQPPSDLQARLDAWHKGQPGGVAVAWVDAQGTSFFQSGQFSSDDPRPITPDTLFEIGSVTKVFTALLLAESERLGKVSRDDPAAKYLLPADDPAQARLAKITLLSLTTHTSGLPPLPANIRTAGASRSDPYATYDRAALVKALQIHGPTAVVGRSVSYSNYGVSVLGEALAAAWGTSYAGALRTQVLKPLGLDHTTVGIAGAPAPVGLAPAHANGKQVPHWTFLACAPAGALRSSARDLAGFLAACLGFRETPLRAALDRTFQPHYANEDLGGHVALAWMLTDDVEQPLVWHNGGTGGSRAFVAFNPKTRAGIVILVNNQKSPDALGFALLGAKPSQPRTAVANAADYPGQYPLTPAFSIQITESKGSLSAQATNQSPLRLRPVAADRFAIIGVPAEISFERDAQGKITALVLDQNGVKQRGPRR